jgi:aspartyl aminopeptidase
VPRFKGKKSTQHTKRKQENTLLMLNQSWGLGSSGKVLASHSQSPEFNLKSHKKENKSMKPEPDMTYMLKI